LRGKVNCQEPLALHTTFKIGGPAQFFVVPDDIKDLRSLVIAAHTQKIPLRILGAGSNILVCDKGVKGIIVHLAGRYFKKISYRSCGIEAYAGVVLPLFLQRSRQRGFYGAEFLAGIPGTVGGAVMMNAGAWGRNIGDLVEKVTVMDYNGEIRTLSRSKIRFRYRGSDLSKYIVLSALFALKKGKSAQEEVALEEYFARRQATQDTSFPSAGCIFKNPQGQSAGRLIELCGFKGKNIHGAMVSRRHANFIVNQRNATAHDVMSLMRLIQARVKKRYGTALRPEIKIWR